MIFTGDFWFAMRASVTMSTSEKYSRFCWCWPTDKLIAFYRRVHPSIYGWQPIAKLCPELPQVRDFAANTANWVAGCVMVYTAMFGIGMLVFRHWLSGVLLLLASGVAGWLIFWNLSRQGWGTL